jgi:hypothetical protein
MMQLENKSFLPLQQCPGPMYDCHSPCCLRVHDLWPSYESSSFPITHMSCVRFT